MQTNRRFRADERLRRKGDFGRVYARRCCVSDARLVLYVAPNGLSWSRLGMSVSRRFGGAVRRNLVRRRIRESYRRQKDLLPTGFDVICIPRAPADGTQCLSASLLRLFERAVGRLEAKEQRGRGDPRASRKEC